MGKPTGFLEINRHERSLTPIDKRIKNYKEFVRPLAQPELVRQATRCMDCGIPFCHNGCPVHNQIPDWNDLVYQKDFKRALDNLHSTNNFPEFTGRICPAPCEAACTLNLIEEPVTIKTIECALADKGWEEGWIEPEIIKDKTNKSVGIVGSGPAGLACAQQLIRAGHQVHIYEKNAKAGGLLRYGIPDFKMEKHLIDRRIQQMEKEGIMFHYNQNVGVNCETKKLVNQFDALVLAGGAEEPRDLPIGERQLEGVHFAMEFLTQQNRRVGQEAFLAQDISAKGKNVVVIGGGDTGSDCIGTSIRQAARSVVQLEIMPQPPLKENKGLTWPHWPLKLRTSSSQAEGAKRDFSVMTKRFLGKNGVLSGIECVRVDEALKPIRGSEFEIKAELVLLAMGFLHPIKAGLLEDLGVMLDERGNVKASTDHYHSSQKNIFACGDMRRGQSLVVWAIREGRQCAREVDFALQGKTNLPR